MRTPPGANSNNMSTVTSNSINGNISIETTASNSTPLPAADTPDRDIDFISNGGSPATTAPSSIPKSEAEDPIAALISPLLARGFRGPEPERLEQESQVPNADNQDQETPIDQLIKALAEKRGLLPASLVANGVRPDKSFGGEDGFALPYFQINGAGERVSTEDPPGKQYLRTRLPEKLSGDRKYTQERGTHPHIYTPFGVEDLLGHENPFRYLDGVQRLLIQEGEIKSLSVVEAGFPSVGLGGITSFTDGMGSLHQELITILLAFLVEEVVFIGDTDAAINPQFAKAACNMARQIGEAGLRCDLKVVTMPFSGHPACKGIDDRRKQLGDEGKFQEELLALIASAIKVEGARKPQDLAEILFQRQEPAIRTYIPATQGEQRGWLVRRILSLHSDVGEMFVNVDLRELCKSSGLINDKRFNDMLKKRRADDLNSRAQRAREHRPTPEMHYYPSGKNPYFWLGSGGVFTCGGKKEALEELKRLGFASYTLPGSNLPEDRSFLAGIINKPIGYAGGIAGMQAGIRRINGKSILVTSSPDLIAHKQGPWRVISDFLHSRLDYGRQSQPEWQTDILLDWLSLSARQLYLNGGGHCPAQILVLGGPRRKGKDVLASDIIAQVLGGRIAKPIEKFKGNTRFSAELTASEMWHISDELDSVSPQTKAALEEAFKQTAVSPTIRLEGKFGDVESVPCYRRLVVTCNDDPTSMEYFPGLRENFSDKLILLDVQGDPFFGEGTAFATFSSWRTAVTAELPQFVHYLLHEHVIAAGRRCPHYGVQSYINPYLSSVLLELNPATPLHEIIVNSGIWDSGAFALGERDGRREVSVQATAILGYLDEQNKAMIDRLGIKAANHFGRLLSKLVAARPESYRLLADQNGTARYGILEPEGSCSPSRDDAGRAARAGFH